MWLINTKTLLLEEFTDPSTVPYAILSHTWEKNDEVSFRDMADTAQARSKAGFAKIIGTCEIALRRYNLEYAWLDTCCIDKTSSAELSEAINSMFRWYKEAYVCFVFLSDLAPENALDPPPVAAPPAGAAADRPIHDISELGRCKWFSRGWTLQELIAPTYVEFYDAGWKFRFTKDGWAPKLSSITNIDIDILMLKKELSTVPTAVKMSWAADRETTRVEDRAYSLLGLFDINISMLYGEGHGAFQRLQEEIAKETDDMSLFAWEAPTDTASQQRNQRFRGMFAKSPAEFRFCQGLKRAGKLSYNPPELSITNKGVRIATHLSFDGESECTMQVGTIVERCRRCQGSHVVKIGLVYTANGWVRVLRDQCWLDRRPSTSRHVDICIRKHVSWEESKVLERFPPYSFRVNLDLGKDGGRIVSAEPEQLWDPVHLAFVGEALAEDFVGVVDIVSKFPVEFRLRLTIYKLKGRPVDVEFHGWPPDDWLASNGLASPAATECDLEELLEAYRESTPVDTRGYAGRVRAIKREADLRYHGVNFEASLGEDFSVTVSRVVDSKM